MEALNSKTDPLHQRNRELSILNNIAEALNRSVDLNQALTAALAKAAELLGLHTGWIWLLQEESGESYLAAAQNLPPALEKNPELMEGTCYCLDTYRMGDLSGAANINVVTCSRLKKLVDGTDGLRYHASIPLYAHGKQLGVLNVASTDWQELTPDDLRLLYTVGDMLSIAIERARLYARSVEYGAIDERNRLAREIHDTLAQALAGIALQLETADALMEDQHDLQRAHKAVQQALGLSRASLEEARRTVLDLRAAPLEGRSLTEALAALAKDYEEDGTLHVMLQVTGGQRPLPARIETGIYRIAQETLANISQHARAKNARLALTITPDQAHLVVEDDGQGFNSGQVPAGRFGLVGANERVRLLGGSLQINSSPGKGTQVEVKVPLTEPLERTML
jgi:two-component system NarL family sensor kinase